MLFEDPRMIPIRMTCDNLLAHNLMEIGSQIQGHIQSKWVVC